MKYGRVHGIEKDVSRLVLGAHTPQALDRGAELFDEFVAHGGTTFDGAWIYGMGRQESVLGEWIADRRNRDDVVVIAKGAHSPDCDPVALTRQLGESLERMGIDHADLYLMHHDNERIPVGEFMDVLDAETRAGRIRAFGLSNWTIDRFQAALDYSRARGIRAPVALSNHFGLARVLELPWAGGQHATDERSKRWLAETGTPLFPWSSQSRGFFVRADPADTSDAELVRCYYGDDNFERLRRVRELAAERDVAPTAIALAYVLTQSFPTFALIGPVTPEEIRSSIAVLEVELSSADVEWLDLRRDDR